jgi:glycerol-3-phosphate dehydrogenase
VSGYLREDDRVVGATVEDRLGGGRLDVKARVVVNATGPWLDGTIAPLRRTARPLLRLTKGIHIVTRRATEHAHVLFAESDGRLFFVVPWMDATIVGTTDTDYEGDPASASPSEEDVRYLQTAARRAFPNAPFDEILFTWAGVRALVREEGVSESEVSRKHALYDHERRDGIAGALSVVGGKITAYRAIAEETTDAAVRKIGGTAKCRTDALPLPGADGSRERAVAALALADPSLAPPVCASQPATGAEIVHAVRSEWAMNIGDVLLRRTTIGLRPCQGLDCIDRVAELVARELGWDAGRRAREIDAYRAEVEPMRRFTSA